jgi:hypothetical protein
VSEPSYSYSRKAEDRALIVIQEIDTSQQKRERKEIFKALLFVTAFAWIAYLATKRY